MYGVMIQRLMLLASTVLLKNNLMRNISIKISYEVHITINFGLQLPLLLIQLMIYYIIYILYREYILAISVYYFRVFQFLFIKDKSFTVLAKSNGSDLESNGDTDEEFDNENDQEKEFSLDNDSKNDNEENKSYPDEDPEEPEKNSGKKLD